MNYSGLRQLASSDLTHFRKRIGKKGAERLLKLSVDLFLPKIKEEEDAAKRITGHTVITPLLEATLFKHKLGYLVLFKA